MPERTICDLCGRAIPPHAHYVVHIDVFADPQMPAVTSDELAEADYEKQIADLLEQMKGLSADDLHDQVHRGFEFRICRPCHVRFLANPLGKPRQREVGQN